MRKPFYLSLSVALLFTVAIGCLKGVAQQHAPAAATHSGDIQRGKYLVEEVAKCAECHTPRTADGQLDKQRWLQGAPTWISPVQPVSNWAYNAPPIAGFPAYSDESAVNIFEKGIGPNGQAIRPPMHIYHLSHEDTMAIVAYLRSLPGAPQ